MLTPTHGFLASLFSLYGRRHWSDREQVWFVFGALLPDFPAIIAGGRECLKYLVNGTENESIAEFVWNNVGYYRTLIFYRELLYNFWFWMLVLLFAFLAKSDGIKKRLYPLSYGAIFFHIFLDWPTHLMPVHNYFWPFAKTPQIGLISHADRSLWVFEVLIWIVWSIHAGWAMLKARPAPDSPPFLPKRGAAW